MANDDATDRSGDVVDRVDAGAEAAEQRARTESLDDRATLSQQAKQQRADASAGKPTGITGEFGTVEFSGVKDSRQSAVAAGHVERNASGQVTQVDYPDGPKNFEYQNGQLSRVTDQNGWSWRHENNGWQLYNSNNERTETRLQGDIQVDRQGDFIFRSTDGTREISRPDGTYRREYANGANFERDAQNHVTSMRAPDGSTKQFDYGPDGRLMKETDQNGYSWRRDDGGWHLYNERGQRTGEPLKGDIEVDPQGNYIFKHTDGMRETTGASGSYVRNEANGDVSTITYPDGSSKSFTYGPGGRLDSCSDKNGSWRRESDGGWHHYDNQGNRLAEPLQGDIEMDRQGNFTFVHNDGMRETTRPDGTVTRTPAPRPAGR